MTRDVMVQVLSFEFLIGMSCLEKMLTAEC